jgi:hypothetical protein
MNASRCAARVALSLSVLFGLLASAPDAQARACRWIGTAPKCGTTHHCAADEEYIEDAGDVDYTKTKNSLAEYGAPCIFGGTKTLCCKKEAAATPALTPPDAKFCAWYASDAVSQFQQAANCELSGSSWSANKQGHYDWCMQQKSQQAGWSEHNARAGALADCLKKQVNAAPPKANQGLGVPTVTVNNEVDIYEQPGGVGKPFDSVKANSQVNLSEKRSDDWCHVFGDAVPHGSGWVWCGKGYELQ